MRKVMFPALAALALLAGCETENFDPQGGGLPPRYIFIEDTVTLNPIQVNLVTGGAVQFVNKTDLQHTLVSVDSLFRIAVLPRMSVLYRPDTVPASTITVNYYCEEHPGKQGVITIAP